MNLQAEANGSQCLALVDAHNFIKLIPYLQQPLQAHPFRLTFFCAVHCCEEQGPPSIELEVPWSYQPPPASILLRAILEMNLNQENSFKPGGSFQFGCLFVCLFVRKNQEIPEKGEILRLFSTIGLPQKRSPQITSDIICCQKVHLHFPGSPA